MTKATKATRTTLRLVLDTKTRVVAEAVDTVAETITTTTNTKTNTTPDTADNPTEWATTDNTRVA